MKKLKIPAALTVILCVTACVFFTACSDKSDDGTSSDNSDETTDSSVTAVTDAGSLSDEQKITDADRTAASTESSKYITFSSGGVTGEGAAIDGTTAEINSAGTYVLSGSGNGCVDIKAKGLEVNLVLNGLTLTNANGPAILVEKAEKVTITVAAGTQNILTDGSDYTAVYDDADLAPTAAVYSKDDLTINGTGVLTVNGKYNNAVQTTNVLKIIDVTLNVTSVDDGIIGKDCFNMESGVLTLITSGDGIRSTEDDSETDGVIVVSGGTLNITAGNDAVQASSSVIITGGDFTVKTGGGASAAFSEDESKKGIKASEAVTVSGGSFNLDCADDAVHSNGTVTVSGGTFSIKSGDDGIHADNILNIEDGTLTVSKSYEGYEAATVNIKGGHTEITSSDDGVNAAGGSDGSAITGPGGWGGGTIGPRYASPGETPTSTTSANSSYAINITGGYVFVNASGDGLDANGSITMTDGTVIVSGPTDNGNGALDYDTSFTYGGGTLIAVGSSGMMQAPSTGAAHYISVKINSAKSAGLIYIADSGGSVVAAFRAPKSFASVVYGSADITSGKSYSVYYGGTATGTETNGFYTDCSASGGTSVATATAK
jgi:hypothetical protein